MSATPVPSSEPPSGLDPCYGDPACEAKGAGPTTWEERGAALTTLVTLGFLLMVVLAIHRQAAG